MLLHYAALLLTLSLVHNSKGKSCVRCSNDVPAVDPIQRCVTHSYFFLTTGKNARLPKMDGVNYGNAGYYRSYGAEVYTSCTMTWVYDEQTMAVVHVEDSRGYVSQAVRFKPTTSLTATSTNVIKEKRYFATPNPTPLADYFCVCKVTAVNKPEEVKSCLKCNSSKEPLPPIRTCSTDICYSNQNQPLCYENVLSGDIYHNWPHQLFNNECPYAANKFDNKCYPLDDSPFLFNDLMYFYIGGQLVDSGSVYYVIGNETLVVRSRCDKQAVGLKCQAWIWKNTTGIGERKREMIELEINPKEEQHPEEERHCSFVTFDIRATDFASNIDKNWAVNLVGCHDPKSYSIKQVEFYINFVESKPTFPSYWDVVEPAVTLSPDACACNLTLVSCNPMVTVRRVEHTFRCDNGKLWTGTTTKRTRSTKLSKKIPSFKQSTEVVTTAPIPYWVWIVLAVVLILLTVVMIVVMLYTHRGQARSEPSSKTAKPLSDDKPKQPKMILDNSMFQSQSKLVDDKGQTSTTKDSSSSIHKLVFMGADAKTDTESDYFYSG